MGVYDTNATRVHRQVPCIPHTLIDPSSRPRMPLRALSSGVKSGASKRRRERGSRVSELNEASPDQSTCHRSCLYSIYKLQPRSRY